MARNINTVFLAATVQFHNTTEIGYITWFACCRELLNILIVKRLPSKKKKKMPVFMSTLAERQGVTSMLVM
jgi:hypothetical protein